MPPCESAVNPWFAVDLVIKRLRRSSQTPEQGRRPIGQRETAVRHQCTCGIVPSIGGSDHREIAQIFGARPQPPCLHLGTQGAEFFADPGVQCGGRDGIHIAPTRTPVLERHGHVERTDTRAPAQRVRWKRPHFGPEFADIDRIAIVIAVGIDDRVQSHDVGQA
jgi:hypothetical protein